jgi:hypothetical protein
MNSINNRNYSVKRNFKESTTERSTIGARNYYSVLYLQNKTSIPQLNSIRSINQFNNSLFKTIIIMMYQSNNLKSFVEMKTHLRPHYQSILNNWTPPSIMSSRLQPVPRTDETLLTATESTRQPLLVPELPFNIQLSEYKGMQDKINKIRDSLGAVKEGNATADTGVLHAHLTPISVPIYFKDGVTQLPAEAIAKEETNDELCQDESKIVKSYVDHFNEYSSIHHDNPHDHYTTTVLGGELDL